MPELLSVIEGFDNLKAIKDVAKPADWEKRVLETIGLITNSRNLPKHRAEYLLREAMTTSDFPYLFGDVLDRQVLARYKASTPIWRQICRQSTVPRIYPQIGGYRFAITGGDQTLAEVPEKGEYQA